jgi:hypothetical protein
MLDKFQLFWNTMELCDWDNEGDDDKVLKPVIEYLSTQSDDTIFEFDNLMSELLYNLDTKKLMEECEKADPYASGDSFLYSRCVALINGPAYYEKVKNGNKKDLWDMEFEALLYVPQEAWALKHQCPVEHYSHLSPFCFETGSNKKMWE